MMLDREIAQNTVGIDSNDTSKLLLVLRGVWFKEFKPFYSKLLFGSDTVADDNEKGEFVDKILTDELELLAKDIEIGDSQKWIEWLAWFNTKQMLSQNVDPLTLPRISKSKE